MKRLAALALFATLATGCTSKTEFGPCVGVTDERDPALVYKVSTRNAILGVVFIETIVVPIVVLVDEFTCPVARKAVSR